MRLNGRRQGLLALGALAASLIFLGFVALAVLSAPPTRVAAPAPSILVTDRSGRLLYDAIDPNGGKQAPVALAEIPPACRYATIATEDSRFYEHPGVDLIGIARAAWQNWRTGQSVSGASTLTQQLARNLYMPDDERAERSLRRKLHEASIALRLERSHTKDELLALYLNTTYYGHFSVGIEAAAQAYFGIHARELDLAQCAMLAGLPQAPALYNPVEDLDAARARQAVVLDLMLQRGDISADQAEQARLERLAFASTPFPIEAPHFVMWVRSQLGNLLGEERVVAGGLRVTTTLDLDWQRQAEAIVHRRLAQLRPCARDSRAGNNCDPDADPARRVENAALVALDPATGAVLALVGSPDYFDERISGALNAALALRQPGSAIKPLTYAVALDPERARATGRAPWTAATLIPDLRTTFITAEGEPYVPQNYDRRHHGPVSVRAALANSYNIAAVRTLDAVGVDALIGLAADLGIPWDREARSWKLDGQQSASGYRLPATSSQQPASRFGLALTLGGGEVRLLDLTAAYAAFANSGARVKPYAISRVDTLDGDMVWDASQHATSYTPRPSAIDPRVAFLVSDILSDNSARAPAFGQGNVLEIGRPAAAKTGTTSDWRDNWTLGFTADLAVGVWVGNADNAPMKDVSGITGAGPIWHDFMIAALRDTPIHDSSPPDGLVRVEVCADSGLLPGDAEAGAIVAARSDFAVVPCPFRRREWFIAGTEPTAVDRSHVRFAGEVVWLLPPEYAAWARESDIAQPGSGQAISDERIKFSSPSAHRLRLISPDPNRTYVLDPGLPAEIQQIPVTASAGMGTLDRSHVTLSVDGVTFARVGGPDYTVWWPLARGWHTFQATATDAGGNQVASAPVAVLIE